MAFNFVTASNQYVSATSTPVQIEPLTLFCRGKTGVANSDVYPANLANTINNDLFSIRHEGPSNKACATKFTGTYYDIAIVDRARQANVWFMMTGVFSSLSNRSVYFSDNGVVSKNSSTNNILTSNQKLNIGIAAIIRSTIYQTFNGAIADVAFWSVGLTDAEIASLAKGYKPTRIRPQSLVFYAPLLRNLQDLRGGLALTNNNGATVADHPRVY